MSRSGSGSSGIRAATRSTSGAYSDSTECTVSTIGLDALLALGREPLLERSLRAHRLVEALGERDAADALALLREARLEQRDLLAQLELLLGVVAEERVRHVVVRADALPRIWQLEDGLEALLDALFEVAHATILSAYSRALAQGSESCTRLPATW